MDMKFLHPSAAGSTAAAQRGPGGAAAAHTAERGAFIGKACCCPARPTVRVILPPSPSRPHSTELFLCGHHYRISRAALTAARAVISALPDTPQDIASWVEIEQAGAPDRLS
jgi:hypothetical protein